MGRPSLAGPSLALALAACSSTSASSPPADAAPRESGDAAAPDARDAAPLDAPVDATKDAALDVDKAESCAATFGDALTNAFGRLDGTVLAVVAPNDQTCAMPNMTHLVIQVVEGGAAYRVVVDVLSDYGDPDVGLYEIDGPLRDGAWASGWHPGVILDYVTTLGVHSASFVAMKQADLVTHVTDEIALGAKISVFATSMDEPTSVHLVHRNVTNQDGAIVLAPDTASPHYLLFRFSDQTF